MTGEQPNAAVSLLQRKAPDARQSGSLFVESRERKCSPMPVISPERYPLYAPQIATINTLYSGAYALTIMFDELCRKALGRVKKDDQGNILMDDIKTIYLSDFQKGVDTITKFSTQVGLLAKACVEGEDTERLENIIGRKVLKIHDRLLGKEKPEIQEKSIDPQLGVEMFLLSEALGINIEVHDIRTPLTVFKGQAQIRERRGVQIFDTEIRKAVKRQQHDGEKMRKTLLSPVFLHMQSVRSLFAALKEFTEKGTFAQHKKGWQIEFPEEIPPGFPQVHFNQAMLYSIFENSFTNSQKGRNLLREHFTGIFLALVFFDLDPQAERQAKEYLHRLHSRMEEGATFSVDVQHILLQRRPYVEMMFRDNGIGNDHNSSQRRWRKDFSVGNSDWSQSGIISGTGIAMGAHRDRIKKLFPHSHADLLLRNRSDGKKGAEVVLRVPAKRVST